MVGASGSGKSTLLRLMLGVEEGCGGSLTVDGHELSGIAADSVFGLMGLLDQNVFLFDATIRENITMFRDFPEYEVREAITKAGLDRVIAERGEDCRCGEGGAKLSGGERQRISIARSLLRGAKVLLADEATSALDNETAKRVSDAILALDGYTRVVVTHRLDAAQLARYDAILMMKNGALVESGSFGELMERRGQFCALYTVSEGEA